jgi:hypothetical protein
LRAFILFLVCAVAIAGCSFFKSNPKPRSNPTAFDNAIISGGQDEVRKRLGEPTIISRTPDGHILWVYQPSWKIMPNDKGTVYVEFEDGKVVKVFRK